MVALPGVRKRTGPVAIKSPHQGFSQDFLWILQQGDAKYGVLILPFERGRKVGRGEIVLLFGFIYPGQTNFRFRIFFL